MLLECISQQRDTSEPWTFMVDLGCESGSLREVGHGMTHGKSE